MIRVQRMRTNIGVIQHTRAIFDKGRCSAVDLAGHRHNGVRLRNIKRGRPSRQTRLERVARQDRRRTRIAEKSLAKGGDTSAQCGHGGDFNGACLMNQRAGIAARARQLNHTAVDRDGAAAGKRAGKFKNLTAGSRTKRRIAQQLNRILDNLRAAVCHNTARAVQRQATS